MIKVPPFFYSAIRISAYSNCKVIFFTGVLCNIFQRKMLRSTLALVKYVFLNIEFGYQHLWTVMSHSFVGFNRANFNGNGFIKLPPKLHLKVYFHKCRRRLQTFSNSNATFFSRVYGNYFNGNRFIQVVFRKFFRKQVWHEQYALPDCGRWI